MSSQGVPPEELRAAMSGFPTGVAVVTAVADGEPAGATVNAVTSLSLEPPLMLAALDRGSRTLRAIEKAGSFGINGLAGDQDELARSFATKEPVAAKWDGVEWEPAAGAARIAGCRLWVACDLESVLPAGDHIVVTGVATQAAASPGVPLVFLNGRYEALG
jgi:3-hydroxy-9,10-secoandrosta-1,3,5(10)-triene-9,17-dione monooxygenase reductase component